VPPSARRLLGDLDAYEPGDEGERRSLTAIREFVTRSSGAFSRANAEGHVTASAVVARGDGTAFLLVRHQKLERWLQPGGHLEPSDESVFAAALREAREETGIDSFEFPIGDRVLDVDVHPIPAHGPDPPHLHFDIRHLLTVEGPASPLLDQAAWFSLPDALAAGVDDSLARALRKAVARLGPDPARRAPRSEHRA
jgi:8-oxo-dGTP pyrophosphatase MutT (NUDIX family)